MFAQIDALPVIASLLALCGTLLLPVPARTAGLLLALACLTVATVASLPGCAPSVGVLRCRDERAALAYDVQIDVYSVSFYLFIYFFFLKRGDNLWACYYEISWVFLLCPLLWTVIRHFLFDRDLDD